MPKVVRSVESATSPVFAAEDEELLALRRLHQLIISWQKDQDVSLEDVLAQANDVTKIQRKKKKRH